MASYAAIVSKPGMPDVKVASASASAPSESKAHEKEIQDWITLISQVTTAPENLTRIMETLRKEMEMPPSPGGGFRGGVAASAHRNFSGTNTGGSQGGVANNNWRSGFHARQSGNSTTSAFDTRGVQRQGQGQGQGEGGHDIGVQRRAVTNDEGARPRVNAGRYQSRFKSVGNIEDKILNTVIGNKLNAFTPMTYNDTRDFIYQIMDSGETEFTRDFVEKVFIKAIVEDLYCALFAKLIAEIAHKYPVIYEEMNKYHMEFLKIFDNVREDSEAEYTELVKEKQYRMGYGQFIAELAGLNTLEKGHLMTMVSTVIDKIYTCSAQENKVKMVEEFIDCLVRLTRGLQDRSPVFFASVKKELMEILMGKLEELIPRSSPRPSLSNKARFGLMDLKDIVSA